MVPTGPVHVWADGRELLVACSNDYLGLAWHPEVRAAASGGGAGASRLLAGSRPVHHQLEEALGDLFGRPALLFVSGYQANLAVFSTAVDRGGAVASDAANHASIIDGLRLSRARRVVVPHLAADQVPPDVDLIALEGLYSMDGDVPDLAAYPPGPWLAVDEAHAVGCLGPGGRGAAAAAGFVPDILIGTFGKAYGAAGAFVVGPPPLRELLINEGRSFIFTTAPPEPVAAMALAGLRIATTSSELRERLASNAAALRGGLAALGWPVRGAHHVVPVIVGPRAMDIGARLLASGIIAPAIRYPTVPVGSERIRFTVSAAHRPEHIARILDALGPNPS